MSENGNIEAAAAGALLKKEGEKLKFTYSLPTDVSVLIALLRTHLQKTVLKCVMDDIMKYTIRALTIIVL